MCSGPPTAEPVPQSIKSSQKVNEQKEPISFSSLNNRFLAGQYKNTTTAPLNFHPPKPPLPASPLFRWSLCLSSSFFPRRTWSMPHPRMFGPTGLKKARTSKTLGLQGSWPTSVSKMGQGWVDARGVKDHRSPEEMGQEPQRENQIRWAPKPTAFRPFLVPGPPVPTAPFGPPVLPSQAPHA